METEKTNATMLCEAEIAEISGGSLFPGGRILLWILGKLAPDGIL